MPPPGSYIDIDTIPFARLVTQAEFNAEDEIWFRFMTAGTVALGTYSTTGGTFVPQTEYYASDGSTLLKAFANDANNSGYWVLSAGTYYIRIYRRGGGSTDADFTAHFATAPVDDFEVPENAIVINDDDHPFPASVFTMDGTLLGFKTAVPGGEIGAIMPSGQSLWHDRFGKHGPTGTLALFDAQLDYVTSTETWFGTSSSSFPVIASWSGGFVACDRQSGEIYRVSGSGAESGIIATLPITRPSAIGVSADGNTLYYVDGHTMDPVLHRWDLVNDEALADLYTFPGSAITVAITPNGHPGDIIRQVDGSLVTWYLDDDTDTFHLVHLSAAGDLLASYAYDADVEMIDHLSRSALGAGVVNVWFFQSDFVNASIQAINLATGESAGGFTVPMFSVAVNQTGTDVMFGPSASCTMLRFAVSDVDGDGGGGGEPVPGDIGPLVWVHCPVRIP